MKLIVGLGNPGEKYKNNRHNVGFQFIDYLIENLKNPKSKIPASPAGGQETNKLQKSLKSIVHYLTSNIILVKPLTFMNLSGPAVTELFKRFKLKPENLIIVHDDLDIPLGKFKIQKGTGPLLHNGIDSIERSLGTKEFWRVRIGIDNRSAPRLVPRSLKSEVGSIGEGGVNGELYVLDDFQPNEKEIIYSLFSNIIERLKKEFLAIS